jgi:putative DNA primase/helicase
MGLVSNLKSIISEIKFPLEPTTASESLNTAQANSTKLIPFTTWIVEEKQDKHLDQKFMEERPGILNWLLEGVRHWCAESLQKPNVIASATDEYRAKMDVIGNFIRERCVQREGGSIKARELFKCYQD